MPALCDGKCPANARTICTAANHQFGSSAADGEFVRGEAYGNVVRSFERVPVAVLYIIANIAIAVHLYHGTWSMFQSLGLNNPRYNAARRAFATGISLLIGVGNVLFPILIVTRVVK